MSTRPIYLDYMATTPIDPRVVQVMLSYMGTEGDFGNPSSISHDYGKRAAEAVDKARTQIAGTIGATPREIIFTSGATEANNLAILGAARFYQRKGRHLITLSTEHKSVLDSFQQLHKEGFEVTYLQPDTEGLLDLAQLKQAVRSDTILVSIMHVNNEIGVIQNIAEIGELLHGQGIIFHVDAAQSIGKLPLNLSELSIDLLSMSAHKNYGPKGIGALYIRHKPRVRLLAQSFGGGQEQGLRAGTLATHQIVGMGEAFELSRSLCETERVFIEQLRDLLLNGLKKIQGVEVNGSLLHRIAGNLNVSFGNVRDVDELLPIFQQIAVSSTSACLATTEQPSHVLRAIGLSAELAYRSLRFSIGRFTTHEEIMQSVDIISKVFDRSH